MFVIDLFVKVIIKLLFLILIKDLRQITSIWRMLVHCATPAYI